MTICDAGLHMTESTPIIRFDSCDSGPFCRSWRFDGYLTTLSTANPAEVAELLATAEGMVAQGLYAAGFVSYEAAQGLNPHLPALPPAPGLPLIWFALYRERYPCAAGEGLPSAAAEAMPVMPVMQATLSPDAHAQAVEAIHAAIARGESYQINFTFPLLGSYHGDPAALYARMLQAQRPPFGALIDNGDWAILSASPELFFELQDDTITVRPMKGTAPRGRFPAEDSTLALELCCSDKERAENLMIVDLLRNDLGQVAQTGSVQTALLFALESYPTVHQLTSTITARRKAATGLVDIFRALFPCGSVTGAPKRRSMELIAGLEGTPRGVYCGAIGCLAPGGEAVFSVAIRTVLYERATAALSMGVGSGITWDARHAGEYSECLAKGAFLQQPPLPRLLESLLLDNGRYPRLERHLNRLCWSASRLGHRYERPLIRQALLEFAAAHDGRRKVRLLLAPDGQLELDAAPLKELRQPLRLAVASTQVDPADQRLYLKTDQRERYQAAHAEHPQADEVLLVNLRGELTEGSFTNLVLRLDGRLVTPPLDSGLLPGLLREELLEQGTLAEQVLYPADLERAEEIWLINSIRGWLSAVLCKGEESS